MERGETPEQALAREIKEELQTSISVDKFLLTVEYDYPAFHLSMDCYLCSVLSGELVLLEAEDSKWLSSGDLYSVDWLPADLDVIKYIEREKVLY